MGLDSASQRVAHQENGPRPTHTGQQLPAEQRFLKGAAISVWQNSFDSASQWTAFARRPHSLLERLRGKSPQLRLDSTPDFWNRYHDDIAACRQLGSNSLRLSLEWARIMPHGPGQVDAEAVSRYEGILEACAAAGLEPLVTLHHFVHPDWFERLGGFEREENIRYFEEWAITAFRLFKKHLNLIATFNEPTSFVFTGYVVGVHAPGRRGAVTSAGRVLLNMLRSHSAAYAAIKAQEGGGAVRVGLLHQQIRFEPEGTGRLYGPARWTAKWMTYWFGWDVVHEYLLTGRFAWRVPGRSGSAGMTVVQEPLGRPPCDWLGINYYTRVVLDWRLGFTCRAGEVLTDMGWPIVPEGLYEAIEHCAQLGVPLYVTETGVADGRDDRRGPLIAAYWQQVARSVSDGHDVRGFFYWTLVDNYEWHLGYNIKCGLFEWTEAPAHPRPAAGQQHSRNVSASAAAAGAAVGANRTAGDSSTAPLRVTAGPSAAARAVATITSIISRSGTFKCQQPAKQEGCDGDSVCDVGSDSGSTPYSDSCGAATRVLPSSVSAAAEAAAAAARANGSTWSGRRLREGSLELVRRYAATPDGLEEAQESLRGLVWPHVPLPEALMRSPTAMADDGLTGAVAKAVCGVVRVAVAVVTAPMAVAGTAWQVVARQAGVAKRVASGRRPDGTAGLEEERAALCD